MLPCFSGNNWALTEDAVSLGTQVIISKEDHLVGDGTIDKREIASITNGRPKAFVNFSRLTICLYLKESNYFRKKNI